MKKSTGIRLPSRALILPLFLLGCGGGNGDGGSNNGSNTTVSGAAVKGVVRQGLVEVRELSATTIDVDTAPIIATTTTDNEGNYRVSTKNYRGGPVVITISGGDGVTVRCDIDLPETDQDCGTGAGGRFGEFYPVDSSFKLRSFLPKLTSTDSVANVSSITNVLTTRSKDFLAKRPALGSEGAIRMAISEVNQLVGVDVVRTRAVDLANPSAVSSATPNELAYSALVSAVQRTSNQGQEGSGAAVKRALKRFNDSFANGKLALTSYQELVTAASDQLQVANTTDGSGLLEVLQTQIDRARATGATEVDPEPSDNADADEVSKAKAFVQNVRNTVNSFSGLEDLSETFKSQYASVEMLSAEPAQSLLEGSLEIVLATLNDLNAQADARNNSDVSKTVNSRSDSGANRTARAVLTHSVNDGVRYRTVRFTGSIGNEAVDLTLAYPVITQFDDTSSGGVRTSSINASASGVIQTEANSGVKLTVKPGSNISLTTISRNENASAGSDFNGQNIDKAVLGFDVAFEQKGVSNPVALLGNLAVTVVQCRTDACKASARNNARTEDDSAPPVALSNFAFQGELRDSSSTQQSAKVSLKFTTAEADARVFNIFNDVSDQNPVKGTITLATELSVNGQPKTDLILAVNAVDASTVGDESLPVGSITATLLRGGKIALKLQTSNTKAAPKTTSLIIESIDGSKISIADPQNQTKDSIVPLTVDGKVAATLEINNGLALIRYKDGTFESF